MLLHSNAYIKVENCYSWLFTDNQKIKKKLWECLRFREEGYNFNRAYRQKIWDGFTEFFKLESGRFLTGLLPEIEGALTRMGEPYNLVDGRTDFKFDITSIDNVFIEGFTLRDYQVDYTNQIIEYKRGIIQAPTSAGKSAIMLALVKCIPPNIPTLILTDGVTLIDQIYSDLKNAGVPNLGTCWGSKKATNTPGMITCAIPDSLHKIEAALPKIKCLIVDEVHLMMSAQPRKFYAKMKNASFRLGVSATPLKFGGTDMCQKFSVKGWFGPILKTKFADETGILTTEFLQEKGILSKSKCTFYPVTTPEIPHAVYMDAVTEGIAENREFHKITTRLAHQQKGRTLILVERIAHGDALAALMPGALWVQGKDDIETRKGVIEQLQTSKENIVAIATHGIFNTGVNFFIHNLINAAGGKADHQIIQRMGRGLRTADDKDILNYYDFVFTINDYLQKHSKKRIKILQKEGHEVEVKTELDF